MPPRNASISQRPLRKVASVQNVAAAPLSREPSYHKERAKLYQKHVKANYCPLCVKEGREVRKEVHVVLARLRAGNMTGLMREAHVVDLSSLHQLGSEELYSKDRVVSFGS